MSCGSKGPGYNGSGLFFEGGVVKWKALLKHLATAVASALAAWFATKGGVV